MPEIPATWKEDHNLRLERGVQDSASKITKEKYLPYDP
jgi:hypothetical protein